jgi:predicted metalloendopeptidase
MEYLRDFQMLNTFVLPIQVQSFETFFIYFASQHRQRINNKIANVGEFNNHPLEKLRINICLSRLPVFRAIYNVTKKDKMWWPSTSRIWDE